MTVATLAEVLGPAYKEGYAVAGVVCLGWEDMRAYVAAADAESAPVILQAGPGCRAHTPLPVLGTMFRYLADHASVPVVLHLDHGYTRDECEMALDAGFTSLMYDGSALPLAENIDNTAAIVELARAAGASCEGEIGIVGYADGKVSEGTDPEDAALFARQTGVDAMAVSVGNVHLQRQASDGLDESRLRAIENATDLPLVIHGGSGVPAAQRTRLARQSAICKFNIGTELRMVFGDALREAVGHDARRFDRIEILRETEAPVTLAARRIMRSLR